MGYLTGPEAETPVRRRFQGEILGTGVPTPPGGLCTSAGTFGLDTEIGALREGLSQLAVEADAQERSWGALLG